MLRTAKPKGGDVSDEDAIAALDLRVVSITEDDTGELHINHDGMDERDALWILESAKTILLNRYWFEESEDDEDE